MSYEINPLILEKLDSLDIDPKLKSFIKDALYLEKQKMNSKEYRFRTDYERIIEQYVESKVQVNDKDSD